MLRKPAPKRTAALGSVLGLATVAVAALALASPPVVYLPLMGLVIAGELVIVVSLVRGRMRDYRVTDPFELVSARRRRRRRRRNLREARDLGLVERWEERLNAGFISTSTEMLENIASDDSKPGTVRRAASTALEGWRGRQVPTPEGEEQFDVVIASNFNLPGGTTSSNLNEIMMLAHAGLRVGLIHNPLFGVNPGRALNAKIVDAIDGDSIQLIRPNAEVSCDLLLMRFPPFAAHLRDDIPTVRADNRMLVVNQAPMTYYEGNTGRKRVWDIQKVHDNLREWIGDHRWITAGPLIHQAMVDHHADQLFDVDLASEFWFPSIDPTHSATRGERKVGEVVKVGRHSRDHLSKWPELAAELRACYPERPDYEIHTLGGVETPRKILGRLPANWVGHEFDAIKVGEFLRGLDVYVYYTCSSWLEAFGRAPVEAMAAGVPVVLPPVFKPTFGSGALYAEPPEVADVIDALASDHGQYLKQQRMGFETVQRQFSHEAHLERFRSLGLKV